MRSLAPVAARTKGVPRPGQCMLVDVRSAGILTELSNARLRLPPSTILSTLISAFTCSVLERRELVTEPSPFSQLLYPSASPATLLSLLFVL